MIVEGGNSLFKNNYFKHHITIAHIVLPYSVSFSELKVLRQPISHFNPQQQVILTVCKRRQENDRRKKLTVSKSV